MGALCLRRVPAARHRTAQWWKSPLAPCYLAVQPNQACWTDTLHQPAHVPGHGTGGGMQCALMVRYSSICRQPSRGRFLRLPQARSSLTSIPRLLRTKPPWPKTSHVHTTLSLSGSLRLAQPHHRLHHHPAHHRHRPPAAIACCCCCIPPPSPSPPADRSSPHVAARTSIRLGVAGRA